MTKQWNRGRKHPFRNRKPSAFESKLINNYKKRILDDPEKYPMNISELTEMCDLPFDYEVLYVYNKISSILQRHRRYLQKGIDYFVNELDEQGTTQYQRYVAEGLSEEEIFDEFINFCVSWDVLPVYAWDEDKFRYYLLDLDNWLLMIEQRVDRVCVEFKNKVDMLRSSQTAFPKRMKRELKLIGHKPGELKDYLLEDGK
jgi:hypothetical protein